MAHRTARGVWLMDMILDTSVPRPGCVPRHGAPDLQWPPQCTGWCGLHRGQDCLHDHQLRGQVRAALWEGTGRVAWENLASFP